MSALSTAAFGASPTAPVLALPLLDHGSTHELDRIKRELARELHDRLAQGLYSMFVQTEVFAREQEGRPDLLAQLEGIQTSLREVLNNLRHMLAELRGQPTLAHDFLPAMRESLARYQESTQVKVSLCISRSWPATLPPEACIHVFRIVQEATNNAHKHGGASKVHIALKAAADGQLVVSIRDDGRGIHCLDDPRPMGMGIVGMRERASLMGGVLTIGTCSLGGTTVTASLPKEALSWSPKKLLPAS
jgi:two-component system, NarL family, sensor histidine kinase UhpB